MLYKIKMKINKNKIALIADRCSNLIYTYTNNTLSYIKLNLYINKFIHKLVKVCKKTLNSKDKYEKFLHVFNNILTKTTKFVNSINSINIVINRIRYPSVLKDNKLIIRTGNLKNVVIYITDMKNVKIDISSKNDLISLYSKDINYIKNMASLIKSIKKIDLCTGIGMYYEKEKIMFKRRIVSNVTKR